MSELKKLFRVQRILAMVLAIALAVTSVPVTALAAEVDGVDLQQTAQDTSAKDDAQDTEDGSVQDNAQGVDTEDPVQKDAQDAGDSSVQDNAQDAEENSSQDGVSGETGDSLGLDALTEGDGTQETDPAPAANPAERAADTPDFAFDNDGWLETKTGYNQGMPLFANGNQLSSDILWSVYITLDEEDHYLGSGDDIVQTVTYQWFVKGGEKLGDAKLLSEDGVFPTEVGSYTLELKLPAKENAYQEASVRMDFEVTKAKVSISYNVNDVVIPGTAVKDIPDETIDVYRIEGDDYKVFEFGNADDPETSDVNEADTNEVAYTFIVKDALTGTALGDSEVLLADTDYVVTVVPEFVGANKDKYNKNYEFAKAEEKKLGIGDFKETHLTLELDAKYDAAPFKTTKNVELITNASQVVQVIEASSLTDALVNGAPLYKNVKVEAKDGVDDKGQTKWAAVTTAAEEIVGTWYTAAEYKAPWTEATKTYCRLTLGGKLDAAPTLPGVYVYRVSYEGDNKQYAGSYADIVVSVAKAQIAVKPIVAEGITFYNGQSVKDVLAKISYELPYVDGTEGNYTITDNMWGTSYIGTDKTQPYKPDFVLVEMAKDADGNFVETQASPYTSDSTAVLNIRNKYYVQFNGNKGVYYANGSLANMVDINARVESMDPDTCGFEVKTGEDVYKEYQLEITVSEVNQKIVVDDIIAAGKNAGMVSENAGDLANALVKTYDGSKIFVNYADYKKAKLESGQSDPNTSFSYAWKKSIYSYDELIKTTKDENGKEVPEISKSELENSFVSTGVSISPVNAGVYRLEVSLKDVDGKNYAEPAYVYFVIKRQEITVKFDLTSLEGNVGNTQRDFFANHAKELGDATSVSLAEGMEGKPSKAEEWKNNDSSSDQESIYTYDVSWQIGEKQKEADGTDKKDESGNVIPPVPLSYYDTLTAEKDKYVLMVSGIQTYSNYEEDNNYKAVYSDVMIPINVEAMGEAEIKFAGITTVDGKSIELTKTYDGKSVFDSIADKLAVLNAPITVKEDGKTKDQDVTFADGEYGLIYTVSYEGDYGSRERKYDKLPTEAADWEWTKNAGMYRITVQFGGNKKYAQLDETELAVITVDKTELVLTAPALTEKFKVGDTADDVTDAAGRAFLNMTGDIVKMKDGSALPEEIKKYFTKTEMPNGGMGYLAWLYNEDGPYPDFWVYDTEEEFYLDGEENLVSTGNTRYMLECDPSNLAENVSINYIITAEPERTPIEVVRGRADVSVFTHENRAIDESWTALDISDPEKETSADDPTVEHEVTILDGIPYLNGTPEGNIVRIQIQAPADEKIAGSSSVSYEQVIKKAAGKRLLGNISYDSDNNTIWFDYDATDADTDLSFVIHWAEDYNESFTFLFSKAVKLGNLKDAVAPKSLAFNGVVTSMVVGQEQELDVKITKEQTGDIVCLGYEVTSGKDYMHVNEYGKVTALKAGGKATVMVYPMHVVDGKKQRIEGAKTASVSITVKAVTTPKISKVIPSANGVTVQYAFLKASDGYRREIYVVEGKNVKPAEIEKKVTSMQNEQWKGIFAVEPIFMSYSAEYNARLYNNKTRTYNSTVSIDIDDLNPTKDYTVYVRNVSAMRTFGDGCAVTLSTAGAAKGFATTKIQSSKLSATLNGKDIHEINGDVLDESEEAPSIDVIRAAYEIGYEIPLTAGSVQFSLEGLFRDAARDAFYEKIPFNNANAKQNFTAPKIAYYFYEYIYDGYDAWTGAHVYEDYGYTTTSTLAAVSKSGKVTLKQPGTATIYAVDTVSGAKSQRIKIRITAEADGMKAKNTTMSVGQSIRLERLVDYKQGNKVLDQKCYSTYNRIDVKAAQAALGSNTSFGISNDGYLTAYSKGNISLTLTDTVLGNVTVKVKANDLAPVKNLKAANVIDNRFDVQFEANMYAEGYRIEILDAKKLVRSIYVENLPFSNDERIFESADWYKDEGNAGWRPAVDADDDWGDGDWYEGYWYEGVWHKAFLHSNQHWVKEYGGSPYLHCDLVNGKWIFSYRVNNLIQTTKYTMKVTALYKDAQSKAASKAVTTTKLPAYDYALTGKIEAGIYYAGGMYVTASKNSSTSSTRISDYPFVSGNTYNLIASDANQRARVAGTDTLTWTSSDKKVATVNATAGGYSATLKALKAGTTVIEVKSKVLKGVVARYTITVSTVGDAYKGRDYWGENQDLRDNGDGKQNLVTELFVGVPVAVELSAGQSQRFSFTTTEEGIYEISKISTSGDQTLIATVSCRGSEVSRNYTVSGAFTGNIVVKRTGSTSGTTGFENRSEIKLNQTVSDVRYNNYYVFTAPEDGLYGIKTKSYSGDPLSVSQYDFRVYRQDMEAEGGWVPNSTVPETQALFYELKKGELVYLQARSYVSEAMVVKADFPKLSVGGSVSVASKSEEWFEFTPSEKDLYELVGLRSDNITVYSADFSREIPYENRDPVSDDNGSWMYNYTYQLGEKVYIRVMNYDNAFNMTLKKMDAFKKFAEDGTYTINHEFTSTNEAFYIEYTATEDGFYKFASEAVENADSYLGDAYLEYNGDKSAQSFTIGSNASSTWNDVYLAKGQSVTIRIEPSNAGLWENVKIKAEKTNTALPAEITADGSITNVKLEENQTVWYFFKAAEDTTYTVAVPKMTSASGYVGMYMYSDVSSTGGTYLGSYIYPSSGWISSAIALTPGDTRYIKITNDSTAKEFQIKVEKETLDTNIEAGASVQLTHKTNWVSFTAENDGYYAFSIVKKANNTGTPYVYDSKENGNSLANGNPLYVELNRDETVYWKGTISSAAAVDAEPDELIVTELPNIVEAGTYNDIPIVKYNANNAYGVVKFTSEEAGEYTFAVSDNSSTNMWVYVYSNNKVTGTNLASGSNSASCTLEANQTVYLRISNVSANAEGLTLTVTSPSSNPDTEEPETPGDGDTTS